MKKTIATALAAAFGFVIALLWVNVVTGGLKVAKIEIARVDFSLSDWLVYLITAIVLTVVMVVLIVLVSRLGSSK